MIAKCDSTIACIALLALSPSAGSLISFITALKPPPNMLPNMPPHSWPVGVAPFWSLMISSSWCRVVDVGIDVAAGESRSGHDQREPVAKTEIEPGQVDRQVDGAARRHRIESHPVRHAQAVDQGNLHDTHAR